MVKNTLIVLVLLFAILLIPSKLSEIEVTHDEQSSNTDSSKEIVTNEPVEDTQPEESQKVPDTSSNTSTSNNGSTSTSDEWWKYPDVILTATRNGNDLLVLVNKKYKLPSTYAPSDLVKASNAGIRRGDSYYVRNILISDLRDMNSAAKADGVDLSVVSAYRSYDTQVSTYNYWLSQNNNNVEYVDTFSARPGHSQHQLGTAIDFSTNEINDALGDSFANTKAGKWLAANAYKYGFVISYPKGYEPVTGYKYESWHYRYIGKSNALEMKNSGMILENYLRSKN